MPRVTLRRGLFYVAAASTFSLVLISVHQPSATWFPSAEFRHGVTHSPEGVYVEQNLELTNPRRNEIEGGDGKQATPMSAKTPQKIAFIGEFPKYTMEDILKSTAVVVKNFTKPPPDKLKWFIRGGLQRPILPNDNDHYERQQKLWPDEHDSDRITEQLMFRPPLPPSEDDHPDVGPENPPPKYKKILMFNGLNSWNMKAGRGTFLKLKCPVDTCVLTGSRSESSSVDAILFKDHFSLPTHHRPSSQVWIMYMLECPLHTQQFFVKNAFNWTATYRHDSDIVTPYERWVYYDSNAKQKLQGVNFAANKTKQVAWFVSNCGARNNRLQYAKELAKYINVDIYGACGNHRCPRSNAAKCFEMLNRDYKFYLAFENSNCRDYITEKFFVNGLKGHPSAKKSHNILPIAMGAHPEDYRRSSPERSFIHVDDFDSPKSLAQYLHALDSNDDLYNEYFRWKGTGEFVNTFFMCRLCALLHDEGHSQHYADINLWWRRKGTCINGSWRRNQMLKQSDKGGGSSG